MFRLYKHIKNTAVLRFSQIPINATPLPSAGHTRCSNLKDCILLLLSWHFQPLQKVKHTAINHKPISAQVIQHYIKKSSLICQIEFKLHPSVLSYLISVITLENRVTV